MRRTQTLDQAASPATPGETYSLYGVHLASDFSFANRLEASSAAADVVFTCSPRAPVEVDWEGLEPVYESPHPTLDGESVAEVHHFAGFDVLRFNRVADFYLWPERIACHLMDAEHEHLVEIRLLGPVLSYWLERRGVVALHASAVVAGGRAVAFLAGGAGGKTSLAAALMRAGHPLLTDDVLAVGDSGAAFVARPGYPQMRMWPNEAAHFLGGDEDLETVHPDYSKRRVPVGEGGLGVFCGCERPLGCLYLPHRRAAGGGVEVEPLSPRVAVIELLRNAYSPFLAEIVDWQARRLDFFARLVRQAPVRRLLYPSGFERLPSVCAAIEHDLARET